VGIQHWMPPILLKAQKSICSKKKGLLIDLNGHLDKAFSHHSLKKNMNQIAIRNNNKRVIVPTKDIIRVEASNNYCKIFFNNARPLIVAKVLHWFELNLPEDAFYRIHQTHIINRFFIKEIQHNHTLELTTGEQIQASRRKQRVFKMMVAKIAAE